MNKLDTNLCQYCDIDDEIEHYFISCKRTKSLWQNFSCFTEPVFGKQNLTIAQVLCGILRSDKKSLALNWLVLIKKYYNYNLWKCKNTALFCHRYLLGGTMTPFSLVSFIFVLFFVGIIIITSVSSHLFIFIYLVTVILRVLQKLYHCVCFLFSVYLMLYLHHVIFLLLHL